MSHRRICWMAALCLCMAWRFESITYLVPSNFNQPMFTMQGRDVTEHPWVHQVILLAREELYPPSGTLPQRDRPIGFASVFLSLENPELEDVVIVLEAIEVRSLGNERQSFEFSPTEIRLRPLERSELVFHLSNSVGYTRHEPMQAIATYRVGDRTYQCVSAPATLQP
jgi:hypothetical protein